MMDKKIRAAIGWADIKKREEAVKALIEAEIVEADGCPCLLVEPCSYACSCAHSVMSGGCERCAKYGSMEQRVRTANRIKTLFNREKEAGRE